MKKILRKYSSVMYGNYKKASLKYGLLTGGVLIIVLLLRYLIEAKPNSPTSLADNITLLIMFVLCLYLYKNKLPDKKITLKEGFLLTFYTGIIASILYGMFMYLYVSSIDTQMTLRCANTLRQIPEYANYTTEQFGSMTKASVIAFQSIIYNVVMSVLWALITSLILRNEKADVVTK